MPVGRAKYGKHRRARSLSFQESLSSPRAEMMHPFGARTLGCVRKGRISAWVFRRGERGEWEKWKGSPLKGGIMRCINASKAFSHPSTYTTLGSKLTSRKAGTAV